MPLEMPTKKEKSWGARIFIAAGLTLLIVMGSFLILVIHNQFNYYQYLTRLEYVMGGQTSTVTTEDEEGNRSTLSTYNRVALYGYLADTSGKRVYRDPGAPTGRSISFHAQSAVGEADGIVREDDSGFVGIEFTYEGKHWKFYCKNRSDYAHYVQTVSPEGWFKPNDEYIPAGS